MPLLICPSCNSSMQEINRNGVLIDVCTQCRGVWLDRGEMEKLLGEVRRIESDYERDREAYSRYQKKPYKKESKLERLLDIF
jgi:Zn-finger nucleic acid-binding protein